MHFELLNRNISAARLTAGLPNPVAIAPRRIHTTSGGLAAGARILLAAWYKRFVPATSDRQLSDLSTHPAGRMFCVWCLLDMEKPAQEAKLGCPQKAVPIPPQSPFNLTGLEDDMNEKSVFGRGAL